MAFYLPDWVLPPLRRRFLIRLLVTIVASLLLFTKVLIPLRIMGSSMEPTYRDGTINFCNRLRFAWSAPAPPDVVVVRLAGNHVMYLKRIVAVAGDLVEFRRGVLFVNGEARREDYVHNPSPWDLPPRQVLPGNVYVVGDNRTMDMELQPFGQVGIDRLVGAPLW
jgi:signal peptidase I